MIEVGTLFLVILICYLFSILGVFIPLFAFISIGITMFTLIPPPIQDEPFILNFTIITIFMVIILAIIGVARKMEAI